MRTLYQISIIFLTIFSLLSCKKEDKVSDMNIIYLHHSVGKVIWQGKDRSLFTRALGRINTNLANTLCGKATLPLLFEKYNEANKKNYLIKEMAFPKEKPYGWKNFPYDYYNIWVKNAGNKPFMGEPTLEMLTRDYQVIIFKHCFPVNNIRPDKDSADVNSDYKSLANYKLQYLALRDKLHEFPDTKFLLFTGAAEVRSRLPEDMALRAGEFFSWVKDEWDLPGDNIYLWDLNKLETGGDLYLAEVYAESLDNSHPNGEFARKAVQLLFDRIIDIIVNNGNNTQLTGESK